MGLGPITAAVFDCDGVLVESEKTWLDLIGAVLAESGLDTVLATQFSGLGSRECAESIGRLAGRDPEQVLGDIDARYSLALAEATDPIPAAARFLKGWRLPAAVASNGRRVDVHQLIEGAGLAGHFRSISTIDDVRAGKPDPEIYLRAVRSLGVPPAQTVVFEDSVVGARAASAAGCIVVGVNADPLIELNVDLRVGSFDELLFDAGSGTIARTGGHRA